MTKAKKKRSLSVGMPDSVQIITRKYVSRVYGITKESSYSHDSSSLTFSSPPPASTAHALPMFQEDKPRSLKRTREKERADPVLSRKPDAPIGKHGEMCSDVQHS